MANNRLMIEEKMDLLIDEFKELNAYNKKKEEDDIDSKFDETVKTYNSLMRNYFVHHGAEQASPEQLTALCEEWYKFTRTGWAGHTTFAQTSVTAVSTGTPGGDNVGLTCTPSTDTKANVDQYAGLPQFACVDVNYEVTSDGDILITAIDGTEVTGIQDITNILSTHAPGDRVTVTLYRQGTRGNELTFDVTITLLEDKGETQN